jgi:hypothetical protein
MATMNAEYIRISKNEGTVAYVKILSGDFFKQTVNIKTNLLPAQPVTKVKLPMCKTRKRIHNLPYVLVCSLVSLSESSVA